MTEEALMVDGGIIQDTVFVQDKQSVFFARTDRSRVHETKTHHVPERSESTRKQFQRKRGDLTSCIFVSGNTMTV